MLFNSYGFLLFFLFILLLSRWISGWYARKVLLLTASYIFYAAWNPPFVILLWVSTATDWFLARRIYDVDNTRHRRMLLCCSLLVNLGLLAFFKYGDFVLDNCVIAVGWLEVSWKRPEWSIVLPVGISFYTFQTLSYTLDVYRRKMAPGSSFLDYALYVTFFPQLVAGPIVRAVNFIPQCKESKKGSEAQLGWGATLFVIGLFNKVVVADRLMSPVVEQVYDARATIGFLDAWLGTFAFAGQIFCDFAGYSTCAIGVALCLGFDLPDNFRFPYAAVGFSDFWRRWHISLSTWLRDYVYISMGGNRRGQARAYFNVLMTMLIGGLWHGASWLFVVWGGVHGLYLVGERLLKRLLGGFSLWSTMPASILLAWFTFLLTCIGWVFFRAATLSDAIRMLGAMVCFSPRLFCLGKIDALLTSLVTVIMLAIHWWLRNETLESVKQQMPWPLRAFMLSMLILVTLMCMNGEDSAFIYFQF